MSASPVSEPSESSGAAARQRLTPVRRRSTSRVASTRLLLVAPRTFKLLWRWFSKKARFRLKLLTAVVLLTSPVWALNLVVAFVGHSVVFPLSPYFLRQKLSAIGLYARHRSRCLAQGHDNTTTAALVKRAEIRYRLPRGLLAAVVHVESRGYPHRISSAGAMGPGQLMPDTARELGVDDPFDTAENVQGAARLLGAHLTRFRKVRLAVAAYNAGPGAVRGHIPQNGQTPAYVEKVMHVYATLRPPPQQHPRQQARPGRPHPPRGRDSVEAAPARQRPALALTESIDM